MGQTRAKEQKQGDVKSKLSLKPKELKARAALALKAAGKTPTNTPEPQCCASKTQYCLHIGTIHPERTREQEDRHEEWELSSAARQALPTRLYSMKKRQLLALHGYIYSHLTVFQIDFTYPEAPKRLQASNW